MQCETSGVRMGLIGFYPAASRGRRPLHRPWAVYAVWGSGGALLGLRRSLSCTSAFLPNPHPAFLPESLLFPQSVS